MHVQLSCHQEEISSLYFGTLQNCRPESVVFQKEAVHLAEPNCFDEAHETSYRALEEPSLRYKCYTASFFVPHYHITGHLCHSVLLSCFKSFDTMQTLHIVPAAEHRLKMQSKNQSQSSVSALRLDSEIHVLHANWGHMLVQWLLYTSAL